MYTFIIGLINSIISGLGLAIATIVLLLPDSPFQFINEMSLDSTLLANLNWIIPLNLIIQELTLWATAIGLYYVYSIVLRWVKAIE